MTPDRTQKDNHIPWLDGIRALAAMQVVIFHAAACVWLNRPYGTAGQPFIFGGFAVALFMVVSGFCLMMPVVKHGELRGGTLDFYRRRAWRILPTYYIAVVIAAVLVHFGIGYGYYTPWDLGQVYPRILLIYALLVQNFASGQILGVTWTVAIEWQIYLLLPLIVVAIRKWGIWPVLGVLAVLAILTMKPAEYGPGTVRYMPRLFLCFLIGLAGAHLAFSPHIQWLRERFNWNFWGVALMTLMVISSYTSLMKHRQFHNINEPIFALGAMMVIVGCVVNPTGWWPRQLSRPWLVGVGRFSYSLYLVHMPVLAIIGTFIFPYFIYFGDNFSFILLTIFGFPISLGAGYLFYLVAERPFLQRRYTMPAKGSAENVVISSPVNTRSQIATELSLPPQ